MKNQNKKVINQNYYKKNKLSPERMKRLNEIGFAWNPLEETFEKGFIETVKYKEQYGTPNTPARHITPNGFKLGLWQSNQRATYIASKLSPEQIRRLEAIGFTWTMKK